MSRTSSTEPEENFQLRWTVARKLGVLMILPLGFLAAAVTYSTFLVRRVTNDLAIVSEINLPAARSVAGIVSHQARQHLAMETHLRFAEQKDADAQRQCNLAAQAFKRHSQLVRDEVKNTEWLISVAQQVDPAYGQLTPPLEELRASHIQFETTGQQVIDLVLARRLDEAETLVPKIEKLADETDRAADALLTEVGKLTTTSSRTATWHRRAAFWASLVSLIATIGGIGFALVLIHYWTRPLRKVSQTAQTIAHTIADDIIPDERLKVNSSDEIGYLVLSFNQMLDSLIRNITRRRHAEKALQEQHDRLEQHVEERTAELAEANVQLREEVRERKQAEASLQETNRRLEETFEQLRSAQQRIVQQERLQALGRMASGIAHDLNNALSPILGFSELLLTHPENLDDRERVIRNLQMIQTAAQDAQSVVARLREFYRSRDEESIQQSVTFPEIVAEAISLTQPRWKGEAQAAGVGITIHTEFDEVPPVRGDRAALREVLMNLILNSCDAMPDGGDITIRVRGEKSEPSDAEGPTHVIVSVSDTGHGMTPEQCQRCFEPFFTTKGSHGTGLGLSIVYGIVTRHHGTIDVESEEGKGTTFTIRLPVAPSGKPEAESAPSAEPTSSYRILVVDDEPLVQEVIVSYLTADHHEVETANNGTEALEKLEAHPFDLMITDRAMPEMSGDQLAIEARKRSPDTRIIMLTGFGAVMDHVPESVDAVASKPIALADLRQAVADVMRPA